MPKFTVFFKHLAENDQKHIRHCIKLLLTSLRASETRLRCYEAENAEAEGQSIIKLITNLKETVAMTEAAIKELIDRHGLPDDLGKIDDDYRRDLGDILTGKNTD